MNASELRSKIESAGHETHFFDRKTMQFFGDRMSNFGVRKGPTIEAYHYDASGNYCDIPRRVETWELYRRNPVKHGLSDSHYFDAVTFRAVYPDIGGAA